MRHYDLTPLYRSTVGFDKLFSMLDSVSNPEGAPSYPPYNIERLAENNYRISMAVAGFTEADLKIEVKENTLTVVGEKADQDKESREFLHRGIAARAFERQFQLADYMQVERRKSGAWSAPHQSSCAKFPKPKNHVKIEIKGQENGVDPTVIEGSTH